MRPFCGAFGSRALTLKFAIAHRPARLGQGASRTVLVDSRNVTVVGPDHLVAAIGVKDLVIVHTPTSTLICRPDATQRVRDVVKRLETDRRLSRYL